MPVFIEHYVAVGGKKEADEAADLWRFGPKAWNPCFNILDPRTIRKEAEQRVPLDKVMERGPISTGPDVHVDAILKL